MNIFAVKFSDQNFNANQNRLNYRQIYRNIIIAVNYSLIKIQFRMETDYVMLSDRWALIGLYDYNFLQSIFNASKYPMFRCSNYTGYVIWSFGMWTLNNYANCTPIYFCRKVLETPFQYNLYHVLLHTKKPRINSDYEHWKKSCICANYA